MMNRDGTAYTFAIVGIGVALAVMIVGVSTIAALGQAVPKELWSIGGALSGALVGILVPPPQIAGSRKQAAAMKALKLRERALQLAKLDVEKVTKRDVEKVKDRAQAEGAGDKAKAKAIVTRAEDEAKDRESNYRTALGTAEHEIRGAGEEATRLGAILTQPQVFVPLVLLAGSLSLGLLLGLGGIHIEACKASEGKLLEGQQCPYYAATAKQAASTLIALASAAGGALLGVFATSPVGATDEAKTD